MDFEVINNLGYFEVIEISVWLGIMYFGKCWVDNFFKDQQNKNKWE